MFKNLISPIQSWLLSQRRCVGCGEELNKGKSQVIKSQTIVSCRCGRMFVHDSQDDSYRRAIFEELE